MSRPVTQALLDDVDSTRANRTRFYRPELDAIRFIAFLSVFLYHSSPEPADSGTTFSALAYAGAFGMCLFFVLSSYLITKLLIMEREETGHIEIGKFYKRRALRIWPLYFAFLVPVAAVGMLHRNWHVTPGAFASFAGLFLGNWYLMAHPFRSPIMPLWSISLEEQFYLLWPWLFGRLNLKYF